MMGVGKIRVFPSKNVPLPEDWSSDEHIVIEQPETHSDLFLRVKNHLIERHFRHLRKFSLYDKIRSFSRPLHFQDSMLTTTWLIPNTGEILARVQSTWTENWS